MRWTVVMTLRVPRDSLLVPRHAEHRSIGCTPLEVGLGYMIASGTRPRVKQSRVNGAATAERYRFPTNGSAENSWDVAVYLGRAQRTQPRSREGGTRLRPLVLADQLRRKLQRFS